MTDGVWAAALSRAVLATCVPFDPSWNQRMRLSSPAGPATLPIATVYS